MSACRVTFLHRSSQISPLCATSVYPSDQSQSSAACVAMRSSVGPGFNLGDSSTRTTGGGAVVRSLLAPSRTCRSHPSPNPIRIAATVTWGPTPFCPTPSSSSTLEMRASCAISHGNGESPLCKMLSRVR